MSFKSKLAGLLLILLTGLFFSHPVGDADFGWHLRYGETELRQHRIIKTNEFSSLLPNYSWANHSWGFDILLKLVFGSDRFWLVSLSAGFLIALSFYLVVQKPVSTSTLLTTGIFWFFGQQLLNIGLRSQLFSLLFTALLWQFIRFKHYKFIPLLFLVWANLHGQFIVGLGLLTLSIIPKPSKIQFLTLFASIAVTFINPFGLSLWTTALAHLNDPNLKNIYEWMPWELTSSRMIALIGLTIVAWWHIVRQKISFSLQLPLAAITVMALTSRRIIPYYLIMLVPFLIQFFDRYQAKLNRLFYPIGFILALIAINQFLNHRVFDQSWSSYCQTNVLCSEKAIEFMRSHQLQGSLFNSYRIGGHLIYRLPEMKPMIDGRMTVWRQDSQVSPYQMYSTIVYNWANGLTYFANLNPDYVLIHPQYPITQVLATQLNWPIIYQDDTLILFQNPQLK